MKKDTIKEQFKKRLIDSHKSVEITAEYLRAKGFTADVPPVGVDEQGNLIDNFKDTGDINLTVPIEVKQYHFFTAETAAEFRYPRITVDSVGSFDKKPVMPLLYFIWNSQMTAFFIVNVWETKKHWEKKQIQGDGYTKMVYTVPVKYCRFRKV